MDSGREFLLQFWGHFYYQLEESYKSSMTDVFEPSENGPSETKVGRAQSRDECQKFIALP
jgi:hypothetical protein